MLDPQLVQELSAEAARIGRIRELPESEASSLVQKVAAAYVADPSNVWWWEALSVPADHLHYDQADGLAVLEEIVGREDDALLAVTDDESPPWTVFSGSAQNLISLLRTGRSFEYFLVAPDASWLVFDTHMNKLVIAGRLANWQ